MRKRYWAIFITIALVLSIVGYWLFDGITKSNEDSLKAWQILKPELSQKFTLNDQRFPTNTNNVYLDNLTIFLSLLNDTQHPFLFVYMDAGSAMLWFPFEGLVYYHYVHMIDVEKWGH